MRMSLLRALVLAGVPLVLLVMCGCATGPKPSDMPESPAAPLPQDDFGEELDSPPITEESISETMMMKRHAQVEVFGGVAVPVTGNFELGPVFGIKGQIEALKNVYWGISFDWTELTVGDQVSDLGTIDIESADPDQWFERADKYNFLLTLDYDIPLSKDFLGKNKPLDFRVGLAPGATIIMGEEDSLIKSSGYQIEPFYGFLLRTGVSLRWEFVQHFLVTFGIGYDYVYPNTVEVQTPDGSTRALSGDIDFGNLLFLGGISARF